MKKKLFQASAALLLAGSLSACGGGSSGDSGSAADAFISNYSSALASANTSQGLTSAAMKDSFDASYLDSGLAKADVIAALEADARARGESTDFSMFAQLTLSQASIGNCNGNVCTLSGTLTNNDADATVVPFSVRVVRTDNTYRLYGDQVAAG